VIDSFFFGFALVAIAILMLYGSLVCGLRWIPIAHAGRKHRFFKDYTLSEIVALYIADAVFFGLFVAGMVGAGYARSFLSSESLGPYAGGVLLAILAGLVAVPILLRSRRVQDVALFLKMNSERVDQQALADYLKQIEERKKQATSLIEAMKHDG
jgi:hypothetical protein